MVTCPSGYSRSFGHWCSGNERKKEEMTSRRRRKRRRRQSAENLFTTRLSAPGRLISLFSVSSPPLSLSLSLYLSIGGYHEESEGVRRPRNFEPRGCSTAAGHPSIDIAISAFTKSSVEFDRKLQSLWVYMCTAQDRHQLRSHGAGTSGAGPPISTWVSRGISVKPSRIFFIEWRIGWLPA